MICPLCKADSYTAIHKHPGASPGASIVKCNQCLHVYTLVNSDSEPGKLYSDGVYKLIENRDSIFDKILNWEFKRVIKRINRIKPSKGNLLDFGCGKGKFASLASHFGWKVKCTETAPERAEYAKKMYGLDVNTDFYATGKIFNSESFDAITLFHVLEHLPDPKNLLGELIKHNLAKDGLVVLEVPDFNSLQARIAGSNWIHLDAYRHVSHFTPGKIEELAAELNLETIKTTSFSFHLGVLGMTDSFLKKLGYRKNIIYELKIKKSKLLLLFLFILLPFSFTLEFFAAATGAGGVTRKYFIKQ